MKMKMKNFEAALYLCANVVFVEVAPFVVDLLEGRNKNEPRLAVPSCHGRDALVKHPPD